jgi:hypothetical protein
MSEHEIDALERDARRPNRGSKYYPPAVVLALIEALKKARIERVSSVGRRAFEKKVCIGR